jgi:hypothetical protein
MCLAAHLNDLARSLGGLDHLQPFGRAKRERLFAVHVFAGGDRFQHHRLMPMIRSDNHDGVN